MKNATNKETCPTGQIRTLLKECKVPAIHALKKAGMAASTPFRWEKEGKTPKAWQVERLRLSILELAESAGTLPAEHRAELDDLLEKKVAFAPVTEAKSNPRQILRRIQNDLRELDSCIASHEIRAS